MIGQQKNKKIVKKKKHTELQGERSFGQQKKLEKQNGPKEKTT